MKSQNEILIRIITIFAGLDAKAFSLYTKFSSKVREDNQIAFWKKMAGEEKSHVLFWKKLLDHAKKDLLPQLFENPDEILSRANAIKDKVDEIYGKSKEITSPEQMITAAVRFEFHMLNQSMMAFFHAFKTIDGTNDMDEAYSCHINRFLEMLQKTGKKSPEMDLLGETLQNLWLENRRLIKESSVDVLTGLYNRRGFFNAVAPLLNLSMRRKIKVTVLIADADDFKKINDTHGHQKGDEVLKFIASTMSFCTRKSDIVGRYGGEEFIIFLVPKGTGSEKIVSDRILRTIEKKSLPTTGIRVTVSIGIATGLVKDSSENALFLLIHEADENLYKAKKTGKNRLVSSVLK